MIGRLLYHIVHKSLACDLILRFEYVMDVLDDVIRIAHGIGSLGVAKSNNAAVGTIVERELLHCREHHVLTATRSDG